MNGVCPYAFETRFTVVANCKRGQKWKRLAVHYPYVFETRFTVVANCKRDQKVGVETPPPPQQLATHAFLI